MGTSIVPWELKARSQKMRRRQQRRLERAPRKIEREVIKAELCKPSGRRMLEERTVASVILERMCKLKPEK